MKKFPNASVLTAVAMAICLTGSGCLKTRAQLREDGDEPAPVKPQPAQVQEVQPQGGYAIDEMKNEITRLSGRVEDLERSNQQGGSASNAHKDEIKKLEQRVQELEQAQLTMLEAMKKMQESGGGGAAEVVDHFDKGKAQFDAGSFDAAIETFTAYLKNPKAKRAEEATFYRAEAFYNLKKYSKAITDYSKFTDKFKNSARTPNALYKIGLSFEAIGEKNDAKYFFEELVEKYPKSPEAKRVHGRKR